MDKLALLSLSGDLKRITQSIQRNSKSAERFNNEAKKWLNKSQHIDNVSIQKILKKIEVSLEAKNDLKKAEECLMYSVLLQNRAINII